MDYQLLTAFMAGVSLLLFLILRQKINAFIALLMASITVGLIAGMPPKVIIDTIVKGMGGTLGFVAIVVGLGAIFGEVLRQSGSSEKLSSSILIAFGIDRAPLALSLSGFLIAIPVFFDVAFIILIPVLYALQKKTGKSLLFFAIPLLASLAVTHAFIPPTPGPIAVADILQADLGWIILFGLIVGIPTTIVAGLIYGKFIASRIHIEVPEYMSEVNVDSMKLNPSIWIVLSMICLPIILILANTLSSALYPQNTSLLLQIIQFLGHPIIALLICTMMVLFFLGLRMGFDKKQLQAMSVKALGPAGIIILITGAGGVFKQMLVDSGAGDMLAQQFLAFNMTPIILGFILALIVRVVQGSATVAMITAAGILGPILLQIPTSPQYLALIVLSIAAGASGFSHVNDSGFWLVNQYLGMTEKQTLQSWTIMTGILSITALLVIVLLSIWVI